MITLILDSIIGYTTRVGEDPEVLVLHPNTWIAVRVEIASMLSEYAHYTIEKMMPSSDPQDSIMGIPIFTTAECPENTMYIGKKVDLVREKAISRKLNMKTGKCDIAFDKEVEES